MFFSKKSKAKTEAEEPSMALVRQDSRTTVKTTTAQTKTTSTTQQSSTIMSKNPGQITYQTTKQTVIHEQRAGISVIDSRRTLTEQELQELFAETKLSNLRENNPTNGFSTESLVPSKNIKYESTAPCAIRNSSWGSYNIDKPNTTPVTLKLEETHISQRQGRTVTSRLEQQKVKLSELNPFILSSPSSPLTKYPLSTDARLVQPSSIHSASPITTTSYRSPYLSNGTQKYNPAATPYKANSKHGSTGAVPKRPTAVAPPNRSSKARPGKMYILNHYKFDNGTDPPREGTKEDVIALEETFKKYGLTIKTQQDLTIKEIEKTAEGIRKKDFKDYSCLVVVILTHGTRHNVVSAKDASYNINDTLLSPILRNQTLTNKPKIFIIQACKGSLEAVKLERDAQASHQPPSEVLMCYSTFEGYVAYRTELGSSFIQSLCHHIRELGGEKDVETIVKMVIAEVKKQSKGQQVPSMTTTMTKTYTFGDYN